MADKYITLSLKEALRALKDLEMLVPSLDRIGSAEAELSRAEGDRILSEFVDDWDLPKKLTKLRRLLLDGYERAVGRMGMELVQQELEKVPHWTFDRRRPPR